MTQYLKQKPDCATLESLAEFICGDDQERCPIYRSSSYLTRFFESININAAHDGSTRKWWVLSILEQLSLDDLEKVILRLIDIREYRGDKELLRKAVETMGGILLMEDLKISFQGKDPVLKSFDSSENPVIKTTENEQQFLEKDYKIENLSALGLNGELQKIVESRISEINKTENIKAPLSSIFLSGSTLEGILLDIATRFVSDFTKANSAPKDKVGKVRNITTWSLASLIDVSHELGFLGLDVKKFSHVLRDFRNYIHPFEQMSANFYPDEHTSEICTQVLRAAVTDLIKEIVLRN